MTPEEMLALIEQVIERSLIAHGLIPDEQPPEPPPSEDFLTLTFELYQSVGGNNWPNEVRDYLNRVQSRMTGSYRTVLGVFAIMLDSLEDDITERATNEVRDWARYLGEFVMKEGSEPGIYREVTDGEMFDAFWSLLDRKIRPWVIRNYGHRAANWIIGIYQLCKWWAMALGESLGAGERLPPGHGNPDLPPGVTPPWSEA